MGNVIGIVAEYNPFHNGHARLIEQTRAQLGAVCPVVCVMSGDFVQRGSPAVYSKFARAEAAVRCGADLVLELPLPWSLSSAEGFARGAVGLLGSLGVVTHLSFGSECGELEPLQRVAEALLDPLLGEDLRAELRSGIPFAAARQQAVARRVGALAELLQAPNNILAVEYLKAIYDQRLGLHPLTVLRTGAQHDRFAEGNIRSASELRMRIGAGEDVSAFLPRAAAEIFAREKTRGRGPVLPEALESALLSRLRMLPQTVYNALPGATEGLGNSLYRAAHEEPTLDGVLAAAKSKRYALARIRRMTMCAALGVTAGMDGAFEIEADITPDANGMDGGPPPYARVLAIGAQGRELLRAIDARTSVPVITKPAAGRSLPGEAGEIFALTADAHDLYVLGCPAREERRCGGDWRASPFVL